MQPCVSVALFNKDEGEMVSLSGFWVSEVSGIPTNRSIAQRPAQGPTSPPSTHPIMEQAVE